MKQTDQTLLEQMRITEFEVDYRKSLFSLCDDDAQLLVRARTMIGSKIDVVVDQFYETQTSVPEIALLIGDADTLRRLRSAQRKYVNDLFSGFYNLEYVNNRLRIGLVHKRIGVEPKLYLAAINTLHQLLIEMLHATIVEKITCEKTIAAMTKLFMFDVSFVFETYIRSLVSEIEISKDKSESYARILEEKTKQLEAVSRTDPLTGLLNMRLLTEMLTKALRTAQRRAELVTMVYIDVNDFKSINDSLGHQRGDEVLCAVAQAISLVSRMEDHCFRYGGDEFCVILANCSVQQAEDVYIRRLCEELAKREPDVSISIGCAQTGPQDYVSAEILIHEADERMYAHKSAYKRARLAVVAAK